MLSSLTLPALFWTGVFTLLSGVMCWICEQKFQVTNLPEEEQIWVKFRNWWFLCELTGAIILVWLLLSSFLLAVF